MSNSGARRVGEEVEADSLPRQKRQTYNIQQESAEFHKFILSWSNSFLRKARKNVVVIVTCGDAHFFTKLMIAADEKVTIEHET